MGMKNTYRLAGRAVHIHTDVVVISGGFLAGNELPAVIANAESMLYAIIHVFEYAILFHSCYSLPKSASDARHVIFLSRSTL